MSRSQDNEPSCSRQLARIGMNLAAARPDTAACSAVRLCLLDYLAALLYALPGPVADAAAALLPVTGGGDCPLIASSAKSSVYGSALYHALIATAEDLDDSRYASGLHMSAATFPAALALCDKETISGEEFIRAVLGGYEVLGRLGRSVDLALRGRGFHATGALGPFGSAMAASLLQRLSEEEMVNALGIAASGCGGIFAFLQEGSTSRHMHGALAAGSGLAAACCASAGMTGPEAALEGKDGFFQAYAGAWDKELLLGKREQPEIFSVYHKLWSTCGHAIPAVTALRSLFEQVRPHSDRIREIEISGYKASAALSAPCPDTPARARFSLPAICGIVLTFGNAGVREMSAENLKNSQVRSISERVRVREDPELVAAYPRLRAGRVRITLEDGTTFTELCEAPLGMPENPAPPAMLEEKFRAAAERHFSAARIDAILQGLAALEQVRDMREITRLLQAE